MAIVIAAPRKILRQRKEWIMTKFEELQSMIARLRALDGCPWDRKQTHFSLKAACIEEAAEVICGINILEDTGDPDNLIEELGDLLLQVVMHAQIAEEKDIEGQSGSSLVLSTPLVF